MNTKNVKKIILLDNDLSDEAYTALLKQTYIAIDIETSGLDWNKDIIASIQIYNENCPVFIIKIHENTPQNIIKLIENSNISKIFHYAIFDLGFMYAKWKVAGKNIACTKTASRLLDPLNLENHSLKNLVKRYLGIEINKELQTSNWTSDDLSPEQLNYAASDVLYLQPLIEKLSDKLIKQGLWDVTLQCFEFIPARVFLDYYKYDDIFQHHKSP
jgi:ribonuclease D